MLLVSLYLPVLAAPQDDIPLLRPEERQTVDQQSDEFYQALTPILTTAAKSTVRIWAGNQRLAYGTVVGDGRRILTKWSEIARAPAQLRIETSGGTVRTVKEVGVYEDDDLAVLETNGPPLTPIQWAQESPPLGGFLAAPQPDGRPAAFGVVSVRERNLRDTDHSYLGNRLHQMERMGGPISQVRDAFTHAIQTDMRPQPDQIGGPVVDLRGRVIGITIARADRTRTWVLPAAAVATLLQQAPQAATQTRLNYPALDEPVRPHTRQATQRASDEERLRRHLSGMRQLMNQLREEMEVLEQER